MNTSKQTLAEQVISLLTQIDIGDADITQSELQSFEKAANIIGKKMKNKVKVKVKKHTNMKNY